MASPFYKIHAERHTFKVSPFVYGYLEAAVWSSTDEDGEPLDDRFDFKEDLSLETVKGAIKDCTAFQKSEQDDLDASGLPEAEQGHLFWLNRNGHGVGFWDRPGGKLGDRLSKATKVYGSVDLYVGDDGLVYGA